MPQRVGDFASGDRLITIVDYQMGNVGSIQNMLKKVGAQSVLSSDPSVIADADKLILPGVGAFDAGMLSLRRLGLIDVLTDKVIHQRTPVLGICLGMQLMTRSSEEGSQQGLGWVDADVVRFNSTDSALKVPHMGWNVVSGCKPSTLLTEMPSELRFYFVHSYFARCNYREDVLLTAHYIDDFDAGFERGNVSGVQFHPEKSHKFGMRLLSNFANFA